MFICQKKGPASILFCNGDLTKESAVSLRENLLDCIENSDNIEVNCRKANVIDNHCAQIFCLIHRLMIRQNKSLTITEINPEIFSAIYHDIQLICSSHTALGCNSSCLWTANQAHAGM